MKSVSTNLHSGPTVSKDIGDHLVRHCLRILLPVFAVLGGAPNIIPERPVCEEQGEEEHVEVRERM